MLSDFRAKSFGSGRELLLLLCSMPRIWRNFVFFSLVQLGAFGDTQSGAYSTALPQCAVERVLNFVKNIHTVCIITILENISWFPGSGVLLSINGV